MANNDISCPYDGQALISTAVIMYNNDTSWPDDDQDLIDAAVIMDTTRHLVDTICHEEDSSDCVITHMEFVDISKVRFGPKRRLKRNIGPSHDIRSYMVKRMRP